MDRYRRVAQVWNWLPAFRGVAEYESMHRAALALAVSPSALSRTIRLLEDALGAELFARHAQGVRLTPFGAELLARTRDAMRIIDEAIAEPRTAGGRRPALRLGVTEPWLSLAFGAALWRFVTDDEGQPDAPLSVRAVDADDRDERLLRGEVDVVLGAASTRSEDLAASPLGEVVFATYALAADTPLDAPLVSVGAPPAGGDGVGGRVTSVVDHLDLARAMVKGGRHRVLLPKGEHAGLTSEQVLPLRVEVFAVHRRSVADATSRAVERLVGVLRGR